MARRGRERRGSTSRLVAKPGGRSKIWAPQSRGLNFYRRQNQIPHAILGPKNRPFLLNRFFLCFLVEKLKILLTKNVKNGKVLGRKMAEKLYQKSRGKNLYSIKIFKVQKVYVADSAVNFLLLPRD